MVKLVNQPIEKMVTLDFQGSWYTDDDSLVNHRENGGTLGMVPLIINPMYTLYSGYLLGPISPFKGLQQGGSTARGPPSQGAPSIFPMIGKRVVSVFFRRLSVDTLVPIAVSAGCVAGRIDRTVNTEIRGRSGGRG